MLRIGLTGGLGSGKTTVAAIFQVLGIPVYFADDASKRLLVEREDIRQSVIKEFGSESYVNGIPDRKYLADAVFGDEKKLSRLNAILHPATLQDAEDWMKQQHTAYIIKEAALIFESGADKALDFVIGVKAPLALRIKRAMVRDQLTEASLLDRIGKQMDEEKKLGLCDFIIINDEQQLVIPQVLALHQQLLKLSEKNKN